MQCRQLEIDLVVIPSIIRSFVRSLDQPPGIVVVVCDLFNDRFGGVSDIDDQQRRTGERKHDETQSSIERVENSAPLVELTPTTCMNRRDNDSI